jgi:hypothetical protein
MVAGQALVVLGRRQRCKVSLVPLAIATATMRLSANTGFGVMRSSNV